MYIYDESDVRFAYELYDKNFKDRFDVYSKISFEIERLNRCDETLFALLIRVFEVELETKTVYLVTRCWCDFYDSSDVECELFDSFDDVLLEVEDKFSHFALDNPPRTDEKLHWIYRRGDGGFYEDFTEEQQQVIYRIGNKIYRRG